MCDRCESGGGSNRTLARFFVVRRSVSGLHGDVPKATFSLRVDRRRFSTPTECRGRYSTNSIDPNGPLSPFVRHPKRGGAEEHPPKRKSSSSRSCQNTTDGLGRSCVIGAKCCVLLLCSGAALISPSTIWMTRVVTARCGPMGSMGICLNSRTNSRWCSCRRTAPRRGVAWLITGDGGSGWPRSAALTS